MNRTVFDYAYNLYEQDAIYEQKPYETKKRLMEEINDNCTRMEYYHPDYVKKSIMFLRTKKLKRVLNEPI